MSAESPHSSSDPASETEVATLLEATVAATQFPAPGSAATAHAGTEQPGTWIGRYQLIDKLGEGGFGTVWRAGQREPIHREVALKLVKPGMASAEIIARFAAERQALAMMDHPNIAAVLDAGETESGRPFFVMELVKGQSLAAWCDGKQLSVRQRLAYFIQVCLAIQHAHQKGIIHRDLKPSNILVEESDGGGTPKVIDFGIAKALGAGLAPQFDATLAQTLEGMVIGTPQYMSPEQAGSRPDVDTRSDIYSLGAILYELLTGRPPLMRETLHHAGLEEILRLVREQEIKRPSFCLIPNTKATATLAARCGTTAKRLGETVKGELDWIVLKALEKDRERRYGSANAFAEDLRHYLNDEPVAASPPSRSYRCKKFLRRNKGPVAAAAGIFIALAVGVAVSLWQAGVAREAGLEAGRKRDEAETARRQSDLDRVKAVAARDQAEDILQYLLGTLRGKLEDQGSLPLLQELEGQVDNYYDKLGVDETDSHQMFRRAWMFHNKGMTRKALGDIPGAEESHRKAREIREKLARANPDNAAWQRDAAVSILETGQLLEARGNHHDAEQECRSAVAIMESLVLKAPQDLKARQDLAAACHALGGVLRSKDAINDAAALFRRAMELEESLVQADPGNQDWQRALAVSCGRLSATHHTAREYDEALVLSRRYHGIMQQLVKAQPTNFSWRRELCASYNNMAIILNDQGDHKAAAEPYGEALRLMEELVRQDPANAVWQQDLSVVCSSMGSCLKAAGDFKGAEASLRRAADIMETLTTKEPGNFAWRLELTKAWADLGLLFYEKKEFAESADFYQRGVAVLEDLVKNKPDNSGWLLQLLTETRNAGGVLQMQGDLEAAEPFRRRSIGIGERLVQLEPANIEWRHQLSTDLNNLAAILNSKQDFAGAAKLFSRDLEIMESLVKSDPANPKWRQALSVSYNNSGGLALAARGDTAEAERLISRAVEIAIALVGAGQGDPRELQSFEENLENVRERRKEK